MTSVTTAQLTMDFEPALPERFTSLRQYLLFRSMNLPKSQKVIAADMDISPSMLSRKLNPGEGDTQRFNLDDLEGYLASTGDAAAVIEYLAAKYLDKPEARRARALNKVDALLPELLQLMQALKEA
jgi:hypothetical protein